MNRASILLFTFAALAACGPDGNGTVTGADHVLLNWGPASNQLFMPPETDAPAGIVGDWFGCRDSGCTRLENLGLRFTEDGKFFLLRAVQQPVEDGGRYCADTSVGVGAYTFDEITSRLTFTPTEREIGGRDLRHRRRIGRPSRNLRSNPRTSFAASIRRASPGTARPCSTTRPRT